jgi:uncharacterized protein (DUF1778 family)
LVRRAASLIGVSVAAFVEQSAVARAESLLSEQGPTALSPDAFRSLVVQLDEPGVAIPQLVELFSQQSQIPVE